MPQLNNAHIHPANPQPRPWADQCIAHLVDRGGVHSTRYISNCDRCRSFIAFRGGVARHWRVTSDEWSDEVTKWRVTRWDKQMTRWRTTRDERRVTSDEWRDEWRTTSDERRVTRCNKQTTRWTSDEWWGDEWRMTSDETTRYRRENTLEN